MKKMSERKYGERDIMIMDAAGSYYSNHVSAMTAEGLHSKSDIAAELGYRDMMIDELVGTLNNLVEIAQQVDGWESFPSKPIDDAFELLERCK